jgi:hypothetical protein
MNLILYVILQIEYKKIYFTFLSHNPSVVIDTIEITVTLICSLRNI